MADLVDEMVQGIRARLNELAPAVAEYERLQAAYAALEGPGATGASGGRTASAGRGRGRSGSRPSRPRAPRGQNKAAVFGVVEPSAWTPNQ